VSIDRRLSDVLSEFARTLLTDFPIQAILDHLVRRIVEILPVSAAGVTLISDTTTPRFIAASDESAMRFERLQTDLREGPCLVAYQTGEAISSPDLTREARFPHFTTQARAKGLAAVFTFPLGEGERRLGALDLYRTTVGPLDEHEMDAAQTLADVTTAYLLNAQARADLQSAAESAIAVALHDALTGLANRGLLMQRLEHAVRRSRRHQKTVGVLFVDLDRFKQVNDRFGHAVGDELLVAFTERIVGILRPGDTMARLAGDEFVVLCEELDDSVQAHRVARRIRYALAEPFALSSIEIAVSASIGVAILTPGSMVPGQTSRTTHGVDDMQVAEQLLREADTAMYQVKTEGGDSHGGIDERQLRLINDRLNLSRDLRGALSRGELENHYQPIVSTAGQHVLGAEALLRWSHATLGRIGPASFIPLAEQAGLIVGIGRAVLEQSCRDRAQWHSASGTSDPLRIAVNVSPHQLMSAEFTRTIRDVLVSTDTDPTVVTLEVTESALIQDRDRALVVLQSLKRLGLHLALDDFGTGSSSLTHLRDFPVDTVKIDRTFVNDLAAESTSHHIVESVITLAHRLGITVVAEGVETDSQYQTILGLGCDSYQGYHFSPPVPAGEFDRLTTRPPTSTT
jgi:diguanylate cyclase (GGDEF)-like protein